jgi:diaminopropionate ammonia-lyase
MHTTTRWYHNLAVHTPIASFAPAESPLTFHRRLPGYAPTPLHETPALAARLGVGRLWVKDEAQRLGMPSFKILGASWAIYTTLVERLGAEPAWNSIADLAAAIEPLQPLRFAAATDGNHGRAVARMARLLGCSTRIFVPAGTAETRIAAIMGEGAQVIVVEGTYDDAVARSAQEAGPHCLVISDTSWPGYETVPRRVIDGYGTLFAEIDAQLAQRDEPPPDVVLVQMGVGALAAAAIGQYRQAGASARPMLIGVEPTRAACVFASLEAGALTSVPGPHDSIMAGLNCGLPSLIAWPLLQAGLDSVLAIDDAYACQGVRELAAVGITAGETGAAGIGGLLALADQPDVLQQAGIGAQSRVLVISTEGATDPVARARLLAADCRVDCLVRRVCIGMEGTP